MFLVFGTCFGLLEVFLGSWIEVFWTLGRVLDSGSVFGILGNSLDSGSVLDSWKCFGFWEVFFDFGACFVPWNHRMFVIG